MLQEQSINSIAVLETPDFLRGGGEMGALIRQKDWALTPLGSPAAWPQSLKTAVRIMLTSRQPIWIGWGPELLYFYNDAYRSIIGGKHPWALGEPASVVWREIWDDIGPMLAQAMGGDEGTFVEEQLLIMDRNGYPEETYFTFSYSPIPNDDSSVGGIICANSEDTRRVIGERQLASLRDLAAETLAVQEWQEVCRRSVAVLCKNAHDLLFASIYITDDKCAGWTLAASCGLPPDHPAGAGAISQGDPTWPIAEALTANEPLLLNDLRERFDHAMPSGAWPRAATSAAVLPISPAGGTGRSGALIVGLNPFRLFDDEYGGYLKLVAGQVAAGIATAEAFEEERKRAEALAEIDRAKTIFFSNVSHEFRTPLTLMLGPLEEVLAKPISGVIPDNRHLVEVAHRNGLRLMKLVNALLDFSRIEAGRVQAEFEETDLAAYTAELASSFRSAAEKAGLRFTVNVTPLDEPVFVDLDMWEKLVLNLLSNAFKFTLEGEIAVELRRVEDQARLTVRDTGIGIDQVEISRLFERFHRIEGAKGRSFEGSGIGLAMVHELVQLHGGKITVESDPGMGTAFNVFIPLGRKHLPADRVVEPRAGAHPSSDGLVQEALRWIPIDSEQPGGETQQALDLTEASGERARVIVADDNADMLEYVSRLLRDQYVVEAVPDGQAALEASLRLRPDLILTDVMMPQLDGFGLLRAVRADPALREVPVIMLSARAGEEAHVEGLQAGADDYLVKPFSARELIARVSANLELARARRAATQALRQLNAQLALESARLSTMFEQAPTFMAMLRGPEHVFELANPAYLQLVGHREVLGRTVQDALPEVHDQGFIDLLDRVYRTGEAFVGDGVRVGLQRSRGAAPEDRFLDFVYQPIVDASGSTTGIFVQGTDVTARTEAEVDLRELNETLEARVAERSAELERAQEQLRQSQKLEAMGQLTGGVAHDFNNLLTPIIGSLDLLVRRGLGGEREQRLIDGALQSAERAKGLVQRLLAFARRQPLQATAVDVAVLITGMADLVESTSGPHVRVQVDAPADLPAAVADPNQLEMAILNLSVNARDAMPDGGTLTISAKAEMITLGSHSLAAGGYVRVTVADTGLGMDQATAARAIEPFYSTKGIGKGTGLGLSMVHGLASQLGGALEIESSLGSGTRIHLWLPISKQAAEEQATAATTPIAETPAGRTALLVDDEDLVRATTADMLNELGYDVVEAASAEEALVLLKTGLTPDVVITDHLMAGLSGAELARRLRDQSISIPVLIVSGYAETEALAPDMPRLTKPFRQTELEAALGHLSQSNAH